MDYWKVLSAYETIGPYLNNMNYQRQYEGTKINR